MDNSVYKKDIILQVFRIFSGGVMLVHIGYRYEISGFIGKVCQFGQYGLYAFFIISGYFAATWDGKNKIKYIKKKMVRLIPAYYLILMIYITLHSFIINDVPADMYGMGWFRFIIGLNSLLPSGVIFWKGIHAIWYVSAVWIFYLVHAILWSRLKDFHINFWINLFFVFSILAVTVGKIDSLYSVNILAFIQYFVLGIIAKKYDRKKRNFGVVVLIVVPIIVYILNDYWLSKNIAFSLMFALVIIFVKDRWRVYPNKAMEGMLNKLDQHTYALFLVHPFFIDFLGPYTMNTTIPKSLQILIFLIVTTVSVIIVRLFEVKMQYFMTKA